jgi:hypothetical protein
LAAVWYLVRPNKVITDVLLGLGILLDIDTSNRKIRAKTTLGAVNVDDRHVLVRSGSMVTISILALMSMFMDSLPRDVVNNNLLDTQ